MGHGGHGCNSRTIMGCVVAPAQVLTATGFVNGRWQFSTPPPQNPHPWPITKKFGTGDCVGGPYGCAKFGANSLIGGFWANG